MRCFFSRRVVHEGTLVHAVSVLSQWTSRLVVEVPPALLDWLKKVFTLKASTSAVRHAYLQAMLGAFKGRIHTHTHSVLLYSERHSSVHTDTLVLPSPHHRRHTGQGLGPGVPSPPDSGKGCGPELPACTPGRRRGGFCSPQSIGSA